MADGCGIGTQSPCGERYKKPFVQCAYNGTIDKRLACVQWRALVGLPYGVISRKGAQGGRRGAGLSGFWYNSFKEE